MTTIQESTNKQGVKTLKITHEYSFTKHDLQQLPTIERTLSGNELKIQESGIRVWLTNNENTTQKGDYYIEIKTNGMWESHKFYFINRITQFINVYSM